MNILFVGGGSIGHIAPSLAVWEALKERKPDAVSHFVCSFRGEDRSVLTQEQIPFTAIDAPRLSLSFLWKFPRAYGKAKDILRRFNPDVIFSKGGYVSIPVCLAAKLQNIPIVSHESDMVSGRANTFVAGWARHRCFGFPRKNLAKNETVTGNPIRRNVTQGSREEGLRMTNFRGGKPVLLVMGGSQGARDLNEAVYTHLETFLKVCDIAHITGRGKSSDHRRDGYWSTEFVQEDIAHLYALADLAVSRAGAGSIAELAANSIPTILVPLRGVGHDHQYYNAEYASKQGGCLVLCEEDLPEKLVEIVTELLKDEARRTRLSKQLRTLHHPGAAGQIAEILCSTLESRSGHQ